MKTFVTGSTGFIGRHLVQQLLNKGYNVHALTWSEKGAAWLASVGATVVAGSIKHATRFRLHGLPWSSKAS